MHTSKTRQFNIDDLDDEGLWLLYADAGILLKKRGLVRTRNIVGERGEFLAINTYNKTPGLPNLQAAPEGTQNVDALSRKGERYSIKTISEPGSTTGVFYGVGDKDETATSPKFEYVVIVKINAHYEPMLILELTWDQFMKFRKWHSTMRAWNLSITKELLSTAKQVYSPTSVDTDSTSSITRPFSGR